MQNTALFPASEVLSLESPVLVEPPGGDLGHVSRYELGARRAECAQFLGSRSWLQLQESAFHEDLALGKALKRSELLQLPTCHSRPVATSRCLSVA